MVWGIQLFYGNMFFYDEKPLTDKNFYRLKQVDMDGRYSYSKIRVVLFNDPRIFVIYPNLVSGSGFINISVANAVRRKLRVMIYDLSGRQLFAITKDNIQNNFQIRSNLSTGIYTMKLAGETLQATEKIKVLKE